MIKPSSKKLNPAQHGQTCQTGQPRYQWATLGLVCLLVGCLGDTTPDTASQPEGVVVGNSMAPHFLGQHTTVKCPSCEFTIIFAGGSDAPDQLVCPNCTNISSSVDSRFQSPAQRVQIDRESPIKRWSVVAFRHRQQNLAGIKRVIGLPGDLIWFENGNVICLADGETKMLTKSLAEQLQTRILVHDNTHQSERDRWPMATASQLSQATLPWSTGEVCRWRRYRPARAYRHSSRTAWSPQIEDNYGFNQTRTRQLNPVNQIMLECKLPNGDREIKIAMAIVASSQSSVVQFSKSAIGIDVEILAPDGGRLPTRQHSFDRDKPSGSGITCRLSNIDHQLIVAIDDHVIFQRKLEPPIADNAPADAYMATVGDNGDSLYRQCELRLWRDIFYFARASTTQLLAQQRSQFEAGYFLVGDNVPVSSDSRDWESPYILADQILGLAKKH